MRKEKSTGGRDSKMGEKSGWYLMSEKIKQQAVALIAKGLIQ